MNEEFNAGYMVLRCLMLLICLPFVFTYGYMLATLWKASGKEETNE